MHGSINHGTVHHWEWHVTHHRPVGTGDEAPIHDELHAPRGPVLLCCILPPLATSKEARPWQTCNAGVGCTWAAGMAKYFYMPVVARIKCGAGWVGSAMYSLYIVVCTCTVLQFRIATVVVVIFVDDAPPLRRRLILNTAELGSGQRLVGTNPLPTLGTLAHAIVLISFHPRNTDLL